MGCYSANRYTLGKFDYNKSPKNSLIVNRIPDYGDGRPDGCIHMPEIHLFLSREKKDSIFGLVKDVKTNEPLFAEIKVYFSTVQEPIIVTTNGNGEFAFTKIQNINLLSIHSIGYRPLSINLKGFKKI